MQPTDWSPTESRKRVLAFGLVVLLVGSMASVAAAQSAIGFRKADVSATTVTVGENVTVGAEAVNVGDSQGGYTFTFESNESVCGTTYCEFDRIRVTIPANTDRRVETNVSFDEPGTYRIRVNDNRAGIVRVLSSRARVTSTTESQRRIDVRANGVAADEPTDFDVPPSNRTFGIQHWSPTTGQSTFQQYLTEYTNRSEVPGTLPTAEQSTLVGAIDFESEDGFEEATVRIGINDAVLSNSTLSRDEVTVYQRNGDTWETLTTSVATEGGNRTVYEATATRGTTYAVGRIDTSISIENTSVRTSATQTGQLVTLDARLANSAPVAGSYTGSLRVNGGAVNQTTVTVPANGETTIRLSHEVTEAGTYNIRLDSSQNTQVIIPESEIKGQQPSDGAPGGDESATGDGGVPVPGAVPSTIFGIRTLYVVGGLGIALGAFVVILLLLRGGGDGGGGLQDNFDPW